MKRSPEKHNPPRWMDALLESFCSAYFINEIQGDLRETYRHRLKRVGKLRASVNYFFDVIRFIKPSIIKGPQSGPTRLNSYPNHFDMLKNYFKIALRSMTRKWSYALINISGLALGFASCLIISLFVLSEFRFDKSFADSDRIIRIHQEASSGTLLERTATSPIPLAEVLKADYPEVESVTRMHKLFFHPEMIIKVGETSFVETRMFLADEHFFNVFSFDFIEGNPETALQVKNQVVLTASTARKYFGDRPALNQTIDLDFGRRLVVSGVISDVPEDSHMGFDLLGHLRFMNYVETSYEDWTVPYVYTYAKLVNGTTAEDFEKKLPASVELHARQQLNNSFGADYQFTLRTQPVTDIHLRSQLDREQKINGNIDFVYLLITIVLFVLLISAINFINLSTARSTERAKEVGVRKALGSQKNQLLRQFLVESLMVSGIALIFAIAFAYFTLPFFNSIIDKNLSLMALWQPSYVVGIIAITVLVGLLAGWYPAWVISSMKASVVLKGKFKNSKKGAVLRNGLVVFQFCVSIILVSGSLIIKDQMQFINNKPLGYDRNNTLLIKHPLSLGQQTAVEKTNDLAVAFGIIKKANDQIELLKTSLKELPEVVSAGGMFHMISDVPSAAPVRKDAANAELFQSGIFTVDNDFMATADIELINGRHFSEQYNEENNVIINESAARLLQSEDVLTEKLMMESGAGMKKYNIVGVVRDFHFQSLHVPVQPLVILNGVKSPMYFPTAIAVKLNTENPFVVISEVERIWRTLAPNDAMLWSFLDDDLKALYKDDNNAAEILNAFTYLAIFVACMGLFGLAAYVTRQKTREIGVRKVLGASATGLFLLISKSFGKLILLAFLFAIPVTYLTANGWLDNFAYRVNVNPVLIVAAGLLTLLAAIITISYETIKITRLNPVKSLKEE